MDGGDRAAIDRWFVRRGVPHFIADYTADQDVLTRALPALTLAFLASSVAAIDIEWPWWGIVLAIAGGLGVLIAAWAALNTMRGRPRYARPDRVGGVELGVFVLAPAVLPIIFGGDLSEALVTILTQLVVLAAIYVATSYGLVAIAVWATRQTFVSLTGTLRLFIRVLPLLLVGFMFLFINAEAWQSAGRLSTAALVTASALFGVLSILFLVSQVTREIPMAARFATWGEVADAIDPGHPLASSLPEDGSQPSPPDLSRREWSNVGFLVLFTQGLRIVLVSLLVGGFFIALGLLIIRADTIELWTSTPPDLLGIEVVLFGDRVQLSRELVQVSAFLAGFAAVYFSVYTASDTNLRTEFFADITTEVRENLAVRCVDRATALSQRTGFIVKGQMPITLKGESRE